MADIRPPLDAFDAPLMAAATVTPPGGASIATKVIMLSGGSDAYPPGAPYPVQQPVRIVAMRRDQVATLTSGTLVQVLEGAELGTYVVDTVDDMDPEMFHAIVRPA